MQKVFKKNNKTLSHGFPKNVPDLTYLLLNLTYLLLSDWNIFVISLIFGRF